MQCWGSTGYCWCVDEDGIELEGTSHPSSEGLPDCEEIYLEVHEEEYNGSSISISFTIWTR